MKNTTTLKGFIKATITAGVIGIYTLVAHFGTGLIVI